MKSLKNLSSEDLEVLALAVVGSHYATPIYLVAADKPLLQAANQLPQLAKLEVKA